MSSCSIEDDIDISFGSPYKNLLKVKSDCNLYDSLCDENDFKKISGRKSTVTSKRIIKPKRSHKKRNQIQKSNLVKNYGVSVHKSSDFNREHIDVALAMSKSLQCAGDEEDEKLENLSFQSQENTLTLRKNLEKFGFKTTTLKSVRSSSKLNLNSNQDIRKKGKFKYITPALFSRTDEDRKFLINDKITAILANNDESHSPRKHFTKENKLFSEELCKYECKDNRLFNHSHLTIFHVESLKISPKKGKVGQYLKNWSDIPGRDRSPSPVKYENKENKSCTTLKKKIVRSLSPDLFDDFDEDSSGTKPSTFSDHSETSTSHDIFNKVDFSFQNRSENSLDELSTSLKKSFNVTDYVMNILNHDSSSNVMNCFNNCTILINEHVNNLESNSIETETGYSKLTNSELELNADNSIKITDEEESKKSEKASQIFNSQLENKSIESNNVDIDYELFKDCSAQLLNLENCKTKNALKNSDPDEILNDHFLEKNENDVLDSELNKTESEKIQHDFDEKQDHHPVLQIDLCNDSDSCCSKEDKNVEIEKKTSILIDSDNEDYFPVISVKRKVKSNPSEIKNLENYFQQQLRNSINQINDFEELPVNEYVSDDEKELNNTQLLYEHPKNDFEVKETEVESNYESSKVQENIFNTPSTNVVVKGEVTPMTEYDELNSPDIQKLLDNVGIKPLKRKRGVEILKYIYKCTHPILDTTDQSDSDGIHSTQEKEVRKKIKQDDDIVRQDNTMMGEIEIVGDLIAEKNEDLIFERKRLSKKVSSCAVPLHIAWFNFVSSNPDIKEKILLYEPLQLENISLKLQEQGYKYNIEDLLTILDRKCINFRRQQNQNKKNRW